MGQVELYHPVTEEKAVEFVDSTTATDTTDEDKQRRVSALLEGASANNAWRQSRSADEQLALSGVPFASAPSNDDPAFTGEGDDTNASA